MAHYLFNLTKTDPSTGQSLPDLAAAYLRSNSWPIDPSEPHAQALTSGDQVLLYLGPPYRVFIARAELASAWTDAAHGVQLTRIKHWTPPIPMETVLARIPPTENAHADFPRAVVRITAVEYESALAAATD
ncbi:hypothetical protein [Kribbella pratensis]|uniref:EVE domain-containing protein n=1 Tax=Kribbella pratensis TaxID=2512112 RepID=A0A4R8BV48_9ACTN|nr:hypothetical protein [Kribbella pratensis]TDW65638.1 hypothetical protein EV653_5650 [Kribbella pratensis]